jgi:hypothetical protein
MAKFRFKITKGQFQNQSMTLEVLANGTKIPVLADMVEFECLLPAQIEFQVSGKGEFDTLVDLDGHIIEDKFVRIDSVTIDRMAVPRYLIESRLFEFVPADTAHPSANTNYFAWNGSARFSINRLDSFGYFLDLYSD